jgi:PAS domain S-box-containing protein
MGHQNLFQNTTSKNAWKGFAILIAGLFLTTIAAIYTERQVEIHSKREFTLACNEITAKITTRLYSHAQLLRSGSSFFAASDAVSRQNWKSFIAHLRLNKNLPGIQGVGFSVIIQKNQLKHHIQTIRKEGFPDYNVKPAGNRELYTSIIYLEPFTDRNLRAFGYDMYSEPVRRKALEQARDLDLATLSEKVTLVQETDKDLQTGALMFVPVYRKGFPQNTVEQRRAAIMGWVYSPYRMYDLMLGILGRWDSTENSRIHLQVYDNDSISSNALLFDSQRNSTANHNDLPARTIVIPVKFNETTWTLFFSQSIEPFSYLKNSLIVIISGCVISFLLFGLFLSLSNTKTRAKKMAFQLTMELRESEKRFSLFMDYLPAIVFFKDKEGRTQFVNKYMDNAMGASAWLGKTMYEVFPNEFGKKLMADDLMVMKLGYQGMEESIVHPDGKLHYYETRKFVIPRDGQPPSLGGISLDITDRKQAESIQQEILDRLVKIASIVPGVVYQYRLRPDGTSCFPYASEALNEIYRVSPDQVREDASAAFANLHPDDYAEVAATIQASAEELSVWQHEFRVKFSDGTIRSLYGKSVPQREEDGSILWYGFITDITDINSRKLAEAEIKRKNEELVLLNAEKDKFFSIISHDLRSPFNAFLGLTQVMVENLPSMKLDEIQKIALAMRNSATNLFRFLENLLDWSRMEQGLIPFNPETERLLPIVNESVKITLEPAKTKGIEIHLEIPEDLEIFADANLLQAVIRNLVSNAVKFTPKGGKVTVSAKVSVNNSVEISVRDTGIGMSRELVEDLFRLDTQTSRLGTEDEPSTGLGLLLCKEFVEKHGGKIWVESEEGKGSTFCFTLPTRLQIPSSR